MRCIHCGKEIEDDSLFCVYCGRQQDKPKSRMGLYLITAGVSIALIGGGIAFFLLSNHNKDDEEIAYQPQEVYEESVDDYEDDYEEEYYEDEEEYDDREVITTSDLESNIISTFSNFYENYKIIQESTGKDSDEIDWDEIDSRFMNNSDDSDSEKEKLFLCTSKLLKYSGVFGCLTDTFKNLDKNGVDPDYMDSESSFEILNTNMNGNEFRYYNGTQAKIYVEFEYFGHYIAKYVKPDYLDGIWLMDEIVPLVDMEDSNEYVRSQYPDVDYIADELWKSYYLGSGDHPSFDIYTCFDTKLTEEDGDAPVELESWEVSEVNAYQEYAESTYADATSIQYAFFDVNGDGVLECALYIHIYHGDDEVEDDEEELEDEDNIYLLSINSGEVESYDFYQDLLNAKVGFPEKSEYQHLAISNYVEGEGADLIFKFKAEAIYNDNEEGTQRMDGLCKLNLDSNNIWSFSDLIMQRDVRNVISDLDYEIMTDYYFNSKWHLLNKASEAKIEKVISEFNRLNELTLDKREISYNQDIDEAYENRYNIVED